MSFFNANQFSALTIATNRPGEGVTVDGVVLKGNSIFSDSCVFGENYKDSYNPPSNGLLVEGKMGIGTSSPDSNSMLHIDGGAGNLDFKVDGGGEEDDSHQIILFPLFGSFSTEWKQKYLMIRNFSKI